MSNKKNQNIIKKIDKKTEPIFKIELLQKNPPRTFVNIYLKKWLNPIHGNIVFESMLSFI